MSENTKKSGGIAQLFKGANASTITILLIFVIMCVALTFATDGAFVDKTNIMNVARAFSAYAIAGLGVSMVIMLGGIDISICAIYGLAGVVAALSIKGGVPAFPAILLGLLVGATGLYDALKPSGVSQVLDALTGFVSAPTSVLILLAIGYDLDPAGIEWR
mgnify:CR=1 FL=1